MSNESHSKHTDYFYWAEAKHPPQSPPVPIMQQVLPLPDLEWQAQKVSEEECLGGINTHASLQGLSLEPSVGADRRVSVGHGGCQVVVEQGCQTYGPSTKTGPLGVSIWPAWWIFENEIIHKHFLFRKCFVELYFTKYEDLYNVLLWLYASSPPLKPKWFWHPPAVEVKELRC